MNRAVLIAAVLVLAGAALLLMQQGADVDPVGALAEGEGVATAGDEESNFLLDSAESVNSMMSNWPMNSGPFQDAILGSSAQYGVPAEILAWLLWKECRYNPKIIDGSIHSRAGALGIAQFMPATAREELGSVEAALDPAVAIPGAARYLARLYQSVGTWAGALAAYNWGIGNVKRKGIERAPAETKDYYTVILAKANATGAGYA